ncbi:MAG: magnesium-translocating P-type ATPase [Proteobacteria bacterium]|nr:magnesium-translocating P-type ATPase [Pseudomonadota bacterium]
MHATRKSPIRASVRLNTQEKAAIRPFWCEAPDILAAKLRCDTEGLTSEDAARRLKADGPNADAPSKSESYWRSTIRRLLEPLSLILLGAGIVSIATGDTIGGSIIVAILVLSIGLDTVQEGHAIKAADLLRRSVALKAEVKRDGTFRQIDVADVVCGDIIRVRAGDIVPADALILASDACTSGEAALTGEPYPVEKRPGAVNATTAAEAANALFRGAVIQTGEATALVVATGRATIFGTAAEALTQASALSPFQRDLHAFGLMIARLTLALVVLVLAFRVSLGRPVLDSLLFSVALAVGLTPELLPMITTVTLSRGALRMARRKVIVKRLAAIHDLGAMTILCTDKTGTLTSAEITLARSLNAECKDDPRAALLGAVAADLGGDRGTLDTALLQSRPNAANGWTLSARRTFDYTQRSGAILGESTDGCLLIVKGAPEAILARCTHKKLGDADVVLDEAGRNHIVETVGSLAAEGMRTIAVASRRFAVDKADLHAEDETALSFVGLCGFSDPPKPTAASAVARLHANGVRLKILSGDDPVIVKRLAGLVGVNADRVLSGSDIAGLSDDALAVQVRDVDAFGRLAPDQKARVVAALQKSNAVVGFLGDGINDAPGLKAADIGLSVEGASGVAQSAADMILLASDLEVVADGVEEGRRTFANILKYIRMGASSNFGNMLSMAIASVALPFLPMLPTQILLNNLLYDLSELGIPFDSVRPDAVAKPQQWDMASLIRFAAVMGPLSSVFDMLTFAVLLFGVHASAEEFRTAWFIESMATQILVIFIIRTNGRPWHDLPRGPLMASSFGAFAIALSLPFSPIGYWFGFVPLSAAMLAIITLIVLTYLGTAELLKPFAVRSAARHRASFHAPTRAVSQDVITS